VCDTAIQHVLIPSFGLPVKPIGSSFTLFRALGRPGPAPRYCCVGQCVLLQANWSLSSFEGRPLHSLSGLQPHTQQPILSDPAPSPSNPSRWFRCTRSSAARSARTTSVALPASIGDVKSRALRRCLLLRHARQLTVCPHCEPLKC
jgi:hypothetical protein